MGRLKAWTFRLTAPLWRRAFFRAVNDFFTRAGVRPEEVQAMLSGYRTYITAALGIIALVGSWLVGDTTLGAALEGIWKLAMPIAFMFLRAGGKNDVIGR